MWCGNIVVIMPSSLSNMTAYVSKEPCGVESLKRAICVRGVARLVYLFLRNTAERLGILGKGNTADLEDEVEKEFWEITEIRL